MKLLLVTLSVCMLAARTVEGITCYQCNEGPYDGRSSSTTTHNCYDPSTSPGTRDCTAGTGFTAYCYATFTINDGIVTNVDRDCGTIATASLYTEEQCDTTISASGSTVDASACTYRCTNDQCNNQATSDLKKCSTTCGSPNGYCDYIKGTCVCENGYSGTDCTTAPSTATTVYRQCVQCNSETDANCNATTTAADCRGGEQYCSATQTWTLASNGGISKATIVRGCTNNFRTVDECSFSSVSDSSTFSNTYSDYTCYSTCDTDGCNTNNPDGVIGANEAKRLYCVQCAWDATDGGATSCYVTGQQTPTVCPSSSTHCYSKVKYWISQRTDRHSNPDPDYRLVSVERGCGTTALTRQCTSSQVSYLSFDEVTCEESCTDRACNYGWPARPQCYSCITDPTDIADGYDTCLENPQSLAHCTYPYDEYCFVADIGRKANGVSIDKYSRSILRGCSYYDRGSTCKSESIRGTDVYQCNHTCTTDGCNQGNGSAALIPVLGLLLASLTASLL